ncbi:hypothetical protein ACHAAC_00835 [Aeromicrobium sp. CF4.19]|uniref:hypothetical protein n=1 Tax=Aeromicrobium sp. CF4.19 TaxID=3373082 RepID=UPI003EE5E8EC
MTRGTLAGRRVALLAASILVVGGCGGGVDDDAIEALNQLEGVESARASCYKWVDCEASVDVRPDVTQAELEAVLAAARGTDAKDITVRLDPGDPDDDEGPGASLEMGPGATEELDGPTASLMLAALEEDLASLQISRYQRSSRVEMSSDGARADLWEAAEGLWPMAEQLSPESITATSTGDPGGGETISRIGSEGPFPTAGAALVLALDGQDPRPVSGALVEGDDVLLGTRSLREADALEAGLEDLPEAEGLTVDVAVTDNVVEYQNRTTTATEQGSGDDPESATEEQRQSVLRAFDERDVAVLVQGTTVVLRTEASLDPRQVRRDLAETVREVREQEPEASALVPVTAELGVEQTVELGTTGSPELVGLAVDLLEEQSVVPLGVGAKTPDDDADPPDDVDATLFIDAEAATLDGLDALVGEVATTFRGWEGPERSFVVGVTATTPEGRSRQTIVRVDREADTWVPSSVDRGTPESIRAGIGAWESATPGG